MKTIVNTIATVLFISIVSCNPNLDHSKSNKPREKKSLNQDWNFKTGKQDVGDWEVINLPHTAKIEPLVVNNQWQGTMWYKKIFTAAAKNKKYYLKFEGVMQDAELWVNDTPVAKHNGGYLPFNVDITSYINRKKENEIKLKITNIDNPTTPPGKPLKTLDFNTYGGVYRDVFLTTTNPIYITDAIIENKPASGGILVHFDSVTSKKATGHVKVHVRNEDSKSHRLYCVVDLISPLGIKHSFKTEPQNLEYQNDKEFYVSLTLDNPKLWSIANPELYKLEVKLYSNHKIIDRTSLKIGVRNIELKADGFYLNHEKVFIRGTNRHQEYPYVGYAISNNANYRDAFKIKQAGFDFVRLSHYPQDESFIDACDELGLLVMNAIPGWQYIGDSTFIENSYQDIRDMVRRDRNHPSVVFWENSLNESAMTNEYMVTANTILKEELPYGDTYSAGWMDHESYDLFIPARQHAKPPYYWNNYKVKERPIFIAEYGDWEYYAQNAGFNQTEFKNMKEEERTSRQLRGHGEKRLLQQALNYQEAANSNRKGTNTIGDANWLMFDYNRGYANDIEASGISDIFRIPKFAFFFYQSQRSPEDTLVLKKVSGPMVKIASYYTENSDTTIRVFSNCDEVELYQNNKLIQRRRPTINIYSENLMHPPFYFELPKFEPGTLKAVGYINGQLVSSDVVRSPDKFERIEIEIDNSGIEIDKQEMDILFLYARLVDTNGTLVPDSDEKVEFSAEGAELIGENPVNTEAGIATILLKTFPENSNIRIQAKTENYRAEKRIK